MNVFVGLSGGVDSATSAALLKQQGHTVIGAFIKIWSPEFLECTWKEDRLDAMRVCATLQIPFLEVDLSAEYKREIVQDMIADYQRGITPNPDVLCNRFIKFGHFAMWARKNGADRIATGHYARILRQGGASILQRGADSSKDQSYFLYQLTEDDLANTLFPIGEMKKSEVRERASSFDLPNAKRRDSQGLCFIGDVSMKDFLGRFIELEQGDVIDEAGKVVGKHDGAPLYTLGERHGFTASGSEPKYVVGTDIANNTVRVSSKRKDAMRRSCTISDIHWITREPEFPITLSAQARYREAPFSATIERERVIFDEPHIAAGGQSLVFYDGESCLGGGIINI